MRSENRDTVLSDADLEVWREHGEAVARELENLEPSVQNAPASGVLAELRKRRAHD